VATLPDHEIVYTGRCLECGALREFKPFREDNPYNRPAGPCHGKGISL
jgi:hypothetical protein